MRFSLYDHRSIHHGFRTWIASLCILSLFCSLMPRAWWNRLIFPVIDAEVVIDTAVFIASYEFNASPAIVFTSATTGYSFFIDGPTTRDLAYRKTTDGGLSWASPVVIDTTMNWVNVAVWYDQWTPGDTTGTKIHILAVEQTNQDAQYTYLDTNGDTVRGSFVAAIQQGSFTAGASGPPSITKNTDGNLFATCNFATDVGGYIVKSTNGGDNWSDVKPASWSSVSIDQIQILPLKDGGDIIAIRADTTKNDIDYRVYDEGTDGWDSSWTTIGSLIENTTYDQWFSAMVRKSTGDIHLTFANETNSAANDIGFWTYSDASRTWSQKTNLRTNDATTLSPVVMVDDELGEIYVAYAQGALATYTNIFVTRSRDGGMTWDSQRRISTTSDDYKSIRTSAMGSTILYAQWYNDDLYDLHGSPIPLTLPTAYPTTIDDSIFDATDEFNASPAVVFTDRDTGYVFYIDATSQDLAYRKTTNGGVSWGSAVVLNTAKDWTNVAVWYDRWTPGNRTGTGINIGAVEDLTDDSWYVTLDTTDDVASAVVLTNTGTTFGEANYGPETIIRGSGGALFSAVTMHNSPTGTYGTVSKSINNGLTWTNITPSSWTPSVAPPQVQLVPLKTDQDIMAIMADSNSDIIKYRIYDEVTDTWDSSWTTIAGLVENGNALQSFSAAVRNGSGDVLLAFHNAPTATEGTNDLEFWHFSDSSRAWTQKTNIVTNDKTVLGATTMIDETTGTIYVGYLRADPSLGVFNGTALVYVTSTDNGATWSAEQPAVDWEVDDYRYVRSNMNHSNRLYAILYDDDDEDLFGATIALLGARFRQSAYRFFANANSLDVGSPLASQDTVATLTSIGQAFRLRILLNDTNRDIAKSQEDLKLEFARKGVGTCANPTGTYANVSSFSTIAWNDNASAKNGAAFTSNANDPGYTGTERNQSYVEGGAFTNSGAAIASGENGMWDFSLKDNGGYGNTYCLRIAKRDGTTLTGYDVYPEITTKGYFSISGSVYTDEGTTGMSAGRRVSVSLNGGAATGSGLTRAGGFYRATLTGATLTGGTIISAYLDGATEKAVTVTLGSGSSMTGVHLYQNHLIVRSDSGATALTSAHLNIANNNGDSDITALYNTDASNNLQVAADKELYVWSGDTFAPGAKVRTHDLEVQGTLALSTYGLTLSGSLVANAGTLTTSTGMTLLNATGETFNPGTNALKNLTLQSSSYTLGSALDVNGTLTIGASSSLDVSASNYAITLTGSFINKAGTTGFVKRSGTVTLDGNDQTLSGSTIFHNLSKTVTTARTLTFYKGYTTTVSGALTLRGATSNLLSLRSSTNGTPARLVLDGDSGTQVIDYLNVQDNDASGGATLTCLTTTEGCVNGGNTTNWFFGTTTRRHFFFFLE